MPYFDNLSNDEMFEEILEMRKLVENALGCDIRQYCFPEKIRPLSEFLNR